MKKQLKELRPLGNELYQRKHWRKVTHKKKSLMEELKRKTNSNLKKLKDLMTPKEIWLDKLRGKIVKMERIYKEKGKVMKNNSIFQKNMSEPFSRKLIRDQHTKDKHQG